MRDAVHAEDRTKLEMMAKQAGRSFPYVRFSVRGSESEIATDSVGHPSGNLTEPTQPWQPWHVFTVQPSLPGRSSAEFHGPDTRLRGMPRCVAIVGLHGGNGDLRLCNFAK